MLQDFSKKSLIEQVHELERIKEEYEKIVEKQVSSDASKGMLLSKKNQLEQSRALALVNTQRVGIFSKIASIFHRGKYHELNQQIQIQEDELRNLEEEYKELVEADEKLSNCREVFSKEIESHKMPGYLRIEDERLIITDNQTPKMPEGTDVEDDKKVIVHCTDFFPKNNTILSSYDGGKLTSAEVKYHGVYKQVPALHHRHEVHCAINNRVGNTGDGAGKWDNSSYIIIDRYDKHKEQMECTDPSDAWTKGTSIELSSNAVIMVRLQDKDKLPIPKEELANYNIIYYDGDPTTCLRNFLVLNNYEILKTDVNCAAHANSKRILQENGITARDIAINFVKDNTYFSKEPPTFSPEDMAQITEVAVNSNIKDLVSSIMPTRVGNFLKNNAKIPEDKRETYIDVAAFVVGSGMKKTEDGLFTFKTDEEIQYDINEIHNNDLQTETVLSYIDIDLIDEIFEMQQQVYTKHANTPLPSLDQISSMPLGDLFKFKNQLACERVAKSLPQYSFMKYKGEKGKKGEIKFGLTAWNLPPDLDDVEYVGEDGNLIKNLPETAAVSDISEVYSELTARLEQIKGGEQDYLQR